MKKKKNGLGRSLIKSKLKKRARKKSDRHRIDEDDVKEDYVSVLDQTDIESFIENVELQNRTDHVQRYYNYEEKTEVIPPKRAPNGTFEILIPRRPKWVRGVTTKKQLQRLEEAEFYSWRKKIANYSENYVLTPFEKNPNVWRQLWRVVESSHLVFQIVDARNPLLFRSTVLEEYAKEQNKEVFLILNKSDLLTEYQRKIWSECLTSLGLTFFFFSAVGELENVLKVSSKMNKKQCEEELNSIEPKKMNDDPSYCYSREELLGYIKYCGKKYLSDNKESTASSNIFKIGMIGYPNVGKSSLINVLSGLIRVSVAATPGKTKYMQTVNLGESLVLFDCPGLVFPTIGSSQAEMVCNGILPIDKLRYRFIDPITFLCNRLPKEVLELTYGIKINSKNPKIIKIPQISSNTTENEENKEIEGELDDDEEEIGEISEIELSFVSSINFLESFCEQKSLMTQNRNHNIPQASRIVLKDYVRGKLVYVHPPPENYLDSEDFIEIENTISDIKNDKDSTKKNGSEEEEEEEAMIINLDEGKGTIKKKWKRKEINEEELKIGLLFNEGNIGIQKLMEKVEMKEDEKRFRNRRKKKYFEENREFVVLDDTGEKVPRGEFGDREKNKKYKEKMKRLKGLSKQQIRMMKREKII